MIPKEKILKGFETAEARWARFGPYYAMFPLEFAFDVVENYSNEGDYIIDPFAGRGSSIFAGSVLGRRGLGIEINPIGWLYSSVKLNPAGEEEVISRLNEIHELRSIYKSEINNYHEFFRICYSDEVLTFLISARNNLDWRNNHVDSTLMAIISIYLHGKLGEGLSNQMRMTKSLGIEYSIKWWKNKQLLTPPDIEPRSFLLNKIKWRYLKGLPKITESSVILGDSYYEIEKISHKMTGDNIKFSLLFTSPPYYSITNYFKDQWLRLWLLGGSDKVESQKNKHKGRFENKQEYKDLLNNVFKNCASMMKENSIVYVRTDKREFTLNTTIEILSKHFPKHSIHLEEKPLSQHTKTQTKLFGDMSLKPGEVDLILTRQ